MMPPCLQQLRAPLRGAAALLVLAGAGPEHPLDLKRVLYDTPYRNEPRADAPARMEKLVEERLDFKMSLDADALQSLFAMTPYFYRTSAEGRARLRALPHPCGRPGRGESLRGRVSAGIFLGRSNQCAADKAAQLRGKHLKRSAATCRK